MLEDFIRQEMTINDRLVPARLQSALALLEFARQEWHEEIAHYLSAPGSSGLKGHETLGRLAHERLDLEVINKTHGRRSSNLLAWGQTLIDIVAEDPNDQSRLDRIATAQREIAEALRSCLNEQPLVVSIRGKSAEMAIRELLEQADGKGKAGEVAQYLVGAKLELRLDRPIPVNAVNLADRHPAREGGETAGDFEIEDSVFEVALGYPDEKHLTQVGNAVEITGKQIWILTRSERVDAWRTEIARLGTAVSRQTVVVAVDAFVGQNIAELGRFSDAGRHQQLGLLFEIYNRNVGSLGKKGIAIQAS